MVHNYTNFSFQTLSEFIYLLKGAYSNNTASRIPTKDNHIVPIISYVWLNNVSWSLKAKFSAFSQKVKY